MQDEAVERLLRAAMAAEPPELSRGFEARVMRCVRPLRVSVTDRLVLVAYAVGALATMAWCMRDLSMTVVVAAVAFGVPVAASASVYAGRVALGRS